MKTTTMLSCALLLFIITQIELCQSGFDPISLMFDLLSNSLSIYQIYSDSKKTDMNSQLTFLQNLDSNNEATQQLHRELLDLVRNLPEEFKLQDKQKEIDHAVHRIDSDFRWMKGYEISRLKGLNGTWSDTDKNNLYDKSRHCLTNSEESPLKNIETIHYNLFESTDSILNVAKQKAEDDPFYSCSNNHPIRSLQLNLHQLLSTISATYIKAYWVVQMGNKFLVDYEGKSPIGTSIVMDVLNRIFQKTISGFERYLREAPRDVWRCDPHEHSEESTFVSLRNLFQTQIIVFYEDCWIGPGGTDAEFYWHVGDTMGPGFRDFRRMCVGVLHYCKKPEENDVFNGASLTVCHSSPDSPRNLESILASHKTQQQQFGLQKPCEDYRNVTDYVPNSICICTCDNRNTTQYIFPDGSALPPPIRTIRYVYLGNSSIAALSSGKYNVVVGAQLATFDEIIYIKIKVGKLLPGKMIDTKDDPPIWLDIPRNVLKNNTVQLYWDQRTVELSDLDAPRGHLLTGVYFKVNENGNIKLGILSKLFHYDLADAVDLLNPPTDDKHGIRTENNENGVRKFIQIRDLQLPPPNSQSHRIQKHGTLNFTISSFKYDLGQTTIPFLDIQEVTTDIPMPMSGASFYYKNMDSYAGFLGIGLKTHNLSQNIESNTSQWTEQQVMAFYNKYAKNITAM